MAQAPANRTNSTVIADVLAQMPAAKQAKYNQMIKDLASTGEEGVLTLVERINAPGKGSNSIVDYALSGLSNYVMAPGQEKNREIVANAYVKALNKATERETKAFIIRQLQIAGKDESVSALAEYLNEESLSGPAARALAAIGTDAAKGELLGALKNRSGNLKTKKDVVEAIAEAKVTEAEPVLLSMLGSSDTNLQKEVLYALGKVGSTASLSELAKAAQAAGYTMEPTGANEAYISLLKTLLADEANYKTVNKAANTLLKNATKAGKQQTRVAALQLLLASDEASRSKLLKQALKDSSKEYRNAALSLASSLADQATYVELLKLSTSAKPEVKTDIINWVGREAKCPKKNETIKNLELRFDLPITKVLTSEAANKDFDVKQAAVWTMVKIGDKAYIAPISEMLTSADKQDVLLAQDALLVFPGDIDSAVATALASANEDGKIAALQLLAARKANSNLNNVLTEINSSSPAVKAEAYKTLKDVVSEKDFTKLCGMLETADASTVSPLQDAVISSISTMTPQAQVDAVSKRMVQAGSSKKHLYYIVLASTGQPSALQEIVKGFETSTGEQKDAAFDALLAWQGLEVAPELYKICKSNTSSNYFDKALDSYVKLYSNTKITGENRLLGLRNAIEIAKTDAQKNAILKQVEKTNTFLGLILAGEYLDNKPVQQSAANAVMNIALNNPDIYGDNVRALLEKVIQVLDNPDAGYQKQAVQKRLDEMQKGEGFVSLFNGKDLTGWKGLVEDPIKRAKMKPAELAKKQKVADEAMRRDWKVEDGLLVFDGTGYDNLCTEKQYGDFEMYVDWMLDPAGDEPDAGIYLRGTPQVQIWDTARVNVGAQVGSGGLYNNKINQSTPSKVADNGVGQWNSFYIKMVGDRVTVVLNGEKVVDDVMLENYWDRSQPIFPVEQIELQAHGSKVYYRNIYVNELERTEPFTLSDEEKKEGFKILFDGINMHEWTGNTVDYTIQDGTISLDPKKSFGGNLYTKNEYDNFVFRFEFQLTPGANNGVGIRTPMGVDAAYHGMEIQILDCEHPIYKDITKYQHHGSVYGIIPAKEGHSDFFNPVGEWNYEEIIADGDNIKVTVNGHVLTEGNIREATKNGTPDKKQHPGLFNKKGHIGFLGHGSPVKFRNIRVKELK
jgi:HEAT repeat protein